MLPQETITRIENEAKELYPPNDDMYKDIMKSGERQAYIACATKYEEARLTQPSFTLQDAVKIYCDGLKADMNGHSVGYPLAKQYFKIKFNLDI